MNKILALCKCLALLALAAALASFAGNFGTPKYLVDQLTDKAAAAIAREGDATRAAALTGVAEARADVLARVDRLTTVAQQELQATRTEASAHIVGLADVADRRLAAIQRDANAHGLILEQIAARELGRAVDGWDAIARPAGQVASQVAEAAPLFLDCDHNPDCAFNRFQGTSKAVEGLAQDWRRAAPVLISTAEKIGANSDRATDASARIAENFAAASKPLPKWLRIVLAIAPPVASTGASAAAAGAAIGVFR